MIVAIVLFLFLQYTLRRRRNQGQEPTGRTVTLMLADGHTVECKTYMVYVKFTFGDYYGPYEVPAMTGMSCDLLIGKTNELIGHTMETDKYTATFATAAQMDTDIENLIGYYVYLPPYLYYGEMVLFSCEFRRNETIIIKRVSVADNGDLLFED